MRKIVAVGGSPGTGKTTLFRKFMEGMDLERVEPKKMLPMLYAKDHNFHILGKYEDGETFAGTDRLSMAVQPVVQEWIKETNGNVLFEGDRIFNQSFLEFCMELPDTELVVIYLKVPKVMLTQRYIDRGSDQSEQFLRGRETKYNNILSNFDLMSYITEFSNENYDDQAKILEYMRSHLLS
jgi:adenylate kinase family enzyme